MKRTFLFLCLCVMITERGVCSQADECMITKNVYGPIHKPVNSSIQVSCMASGGGCFKIGIERLADISDSTPLDSYCVNNSCKCSAVQCSALLNFTLSSDWNGTKLRCYVVKYSGNNYETVHGEPVEVLLQFELNSVRNVRVEINDGDRFVVHWEAPSGVLDGIKLVYYIQVEGPDGMKMMRTTSNTSFIMDSAKFSPCKPTGIRITASAGSSVESNAYHLQEYVNSEPLKLSEMQVSLTSVKLQDGKVETRINLKECDSECPGRQACYSFINSSCLHITYLESLNVSINKESINSGTEECGIDPIVLSADNICSVSLELCNEAGCTHQPQLEQATFDVVDLIISNGSIDSPLCLTCKFMIGTTAKGCFIEVSSPARSFRAKAIRKPTELTAQVCILDEDVPLRLYTVNAADYDSDELEPDKWSLTQKHWLTGMANFSTMTTITHSPPTEDTPTTSANVYIIIIAVLAVASVAELLVIVVPRIYSCCGKSRRKKQGYSAEVNDPQPRGDDEMVMITNFNSTSADLVIQPSSVPNETTLLMSETHDGSNNCTLESMASQSQTYVNFLSANDGAHLHTTVPDAEVFQQNSTTPFVQCTEMPGRSDTIVAIPNRDVHFTFDKCSDGHVEDESFQEDYTTENFPETCHSQTFHKVPSEPCFKRLQRPKRFVNRSNSCSYEPENSSEVTQYPHFTS